MFCFGCATGILQCLLHIQLAPFIPQIVSGSDTDDDGENEKED